MLTWKTVALTLTAVLLLGIGWGLATLAHADDQPAFGLAPPPPAAPFDLAAALPAVPAAELPRRFPYRAYLAATGRPDPRRLSRDAAVLDSLYPAEAPRNERLLYTVLTDSLAASQRPATDSATYLLHTLRWADELPVAARYDPHRATLLGALNTYWLRRVAQALETQYRHDASVKYSFQFRHLNELCRAAKCGVPVAFSSSEKVMNNLVDSRWSYLFTKFWRDSGPATKLGAGVLAAILVLPWLGWLLASRRRQRSLQPRPAGRLVVAS